MSGRFVDKTDANPGVLVEQDEEGDDEATRAVPRSEGKVLWLRPMSL
jgi:hypothetical protein